MALADIVEVACDDWWPGVKLVLISTLGAQQLRRHGRRQRACWPPVARWARFSGRKSWIFWMTPQLGSLPVRQATSRFPIPRRWSSSAGRWPRSKRMWSTFPRMSGTFTRWHGSKPMPASIAMSGRRRRRPDGQCQQSLPVGYPLPHRQECDGSEPNQGPTRLFDATAAQANCSAQGARSVHHVLGRLRYQRHPPSAMRQCDGLASYLVMTRAGGCQVPSPAGRIDGGVSFGQ